jgi:hypothetical protein
MRSLVFLTMIGFYFNNFIGFSNTGAGNEKLFTKQVGGHHENIPAVKIPVQSQVIMIITGSQFSRSINQ